MANSPTVIASVVFDLDGVLLDSEQVWEEVRRAFVEEGGGQWMPDTQRRLMGMNTGEWARYLSQGVGSSSPPEIIHMVLERAGLADAFRAVASSDEVAAGKPAPGVYLLAADRLGVDPASSVAI